MRDSAPYILMLGTALDTRGGVSSVARTYLEQGLFERCNVAYLATHGSGTIVRKICIMAAALAAFVPRLLWNRPALIHMHVASGGSFWRKLAFFSLARAARVPVVLHVHGGGFENFYRRSSPWIARPLIRWLLESAAQVFALSERWARFFAGIAPGARVEVLANPVAAARKDLPGAIPGRISFLGRLTLKKGVFDLLDAFAVAREGHDDAHLVLGGEGQRATVQERARALGIEHRVQLVGWIEGEPKEQLLSSSSIFVLPSYIEGLPVCVLEAMAHGVPVVATAVGGVPDVVSDEVEGLIVPPGDVQALARALRRLLDNPQLGRAMGERGHARAAREYEAPVVCEQLERAYGRLIAQAQTSCSTA